MGLSRFDLHCHTTCSDGTMTPEELLHYAKILGLAGIAITDHDTVNAYESAISAAKKEGIWLGSGVEFSSIDRNESVHILGYDIDLNHPSLGIFCQRHLDRRRERNERIIEKLKKRGIEITLEKSEGRPQGRPHIALALVEKGVVRSVQEAFNQLIGDGKPCFDPGVPITTDETLTLIHEIGGKAFLAHPHLLKRSPDPLLKKPFDGIECYYAKMLPNQEEKWVRLAKEKGLFISGGSDFHGTIKPQIPLGASWVDEETFHKIFEKNKWK